MRYLIFLIHIPLRMSPTDRQLFQRLVLVRDPRRSSLDLRYTPERQQTAQDHGDAEYHQDDAVAVCLSGSGAAGAEFVEAREDLDEDGAEFAGSGGNAVTAGAVAGWEEFGREDVGCGVGTAVERELADDVEDDGPGAHFFGHDECCAQSDE